MGAIETLLLFTLGSACCGLGPFLIAVVAVVALGNGSRVLGERRAPRG